MSRSFWGKLGSSVGGAAVAGFGLSIGRDLYLGIKPGRDSAVPTLLLAICGVGLPVIGGIGITQGYRRGVFGTFFLTFALNIILVALGFAIISLIFSTVVGVLAPTYEEKALFAAVLVTALFFAIGAVVGLARRNGRLLRFDVAEHNERFLSMQEFQPTGGTDVTHFDPDGLALRLLEVGHDRMVFMVVGRRGRRTYIRTDDDGRMLSYSGLSDQLN